MPEIKEIIDFWGCLPTRGLVEVDSEQIHKIVSHLRVINNDKPEILSINNRESP